MKQAECDDRGYFNVDGALHTHNGATWFGNNVATYNKFAVDEILWGAACTLQQIEIAMTVEAKEKLAHGLRTRLLAAIGYTLEQYEMDGEV